MFTPEQREHVKERVLELARSDARIVGAAFVGGSAEQEDRWSDVDLTFAVDGPVEPVLAAFTALLEGDFGAATLVDVLGGAALYRVFLLPGCLQVDLSFAPAEGFGARTPRFRLLFGEPADLPHVGPPEAADVLGWAVHHVVRVRVCLERGRLWLAEHWLSHARENALMLACLEHGLNAREVRGADDLPPELRRAFEQTLPAALEAAELRRALAAVVERLLPHAPERVAERLREVV